jgi:FKBP-type peptidyl-prolyl cis-trans isomerase
MAQGSELIADASRMTVKIHPETIVKGPYCSEGDYVVGYWKKWNGTDGTKMEDVKETGDGRPVIFRLGSFQVSKCLDLAAQQMKSGGEVATITCP